MQPSILRKLTGLIAICAWPMAVLATPTVSYSPDLNIGQTTTSVSGAVTFASFSTSSFLTSVATVSGGNLVSVQGSVYLSNASEPVTITFTQLQDYFGLEWESVDTYNQISFYNGSTLVATISGSATYDNFVDIFASSKSELFDKVVLSNEDGHCCFEVNNLASRAANTLTSPVPEPGSSGLVAASLGALAFLSRRRRKTAQGMSFVVR